ncbi:hypothetical protein L227DRAFT_506144, partial [Lentinus tigrinus ALCF2SS1-6]
PSSSSATLSTQPGPTATAGQTWRDVCLQTIRNKYAGFQPRNDFDIFTLGTSKYRGPRAELGTWLDSKLAQHIQDTGSLEFVMEKARTLLAMSTDNVTGIKPTRGARNVFLRPIPNSAYSIRLFPGFFAAREYCIDFVHTETGVAVNSPFEFELWAVSNPSAPWLGSGSMRLYSLEDTFKHLMEGDETLPGDEKFVVRDGQTCLLKRPGQRDVRFTVPIRYDPTATAGTEPVDELQFPLPLCSKHGMGSCHVESGSLGDLSCLIHMIHDAVFVDCHLDGVACSL